MPKRSVLAEQIPSPQATIERTAPSSSDARELPPTD